MQDERFTCAEAPSEHFSKLGLEVCRWLLKWDLVSKSLSWMFLSHKGMLKAVSSVFTKKLWCKRSHSFLPFPEIKRRAFQRHEPLLSTNFAAFNKGWGSNSHIYLRHFSAMFLYFSAHKNTCKLNWTENVWTQSLFLFSFFFCISF